LAVLLEVRHITKHFGALAAVSDLSFSMREGETLGIMGPNGAGKSTLLNLIMAVHPLSRGEIRFDGHTISNLPTSEISRRGIGRTHQIPQPFRRMTVLENVLTGELYGAVWQSMSAARANALAVLERVGLTEHAHTPAGKLGLLALKRLELARALSLRPRLLLLDEIAAGLVESEMAELKHLLVELKQAGQTMLIIEHILSVLFDLSDRVLVLNFGQRLAEGTPAEIARHPQVIEVYLGAESAHPAMTSAPVRQSRPERTPLLSLRNVSAGYGDFQALFDVSLDIYEGERVALIGVNGAGKTTLIRAMTRQLPLTRGEVIFRGRSLVKAQMHDMVGLGIAQCIEGRKVFTGLTVQENLELGAYAPRARAQQRATQDRVYSLFPILAQRRHQIAGTLSGGEQQMLAIGRALMALPEFIIFDEISLGLAPLVIEDLYQTVLEINRQGTTILLVEQNVHRSLAIAESAYLIEHGRIVLSGTSEALSQNQHIQDVYFGL
jgi:branched-chain amino acid transport system ATP-binding protein